MFDLSVTEGGDVGRLGERWRGANFQECAAASRVPPRFGPPPDADAAGSRRKNDRRMSIQSRLRLPHCNSAATTTLSTMSTKTTQKPRSAWVHFLMDADRRDALRAANPKAKFGKISKLLAAQWRQMDDEAKAHYVRLSKGEQSNYTAPNKGAIKARAQAKVRQFVANLAEKPSPPAAKQASSPATKKRKYNSRPAVCSQFPFSGEVIQKSHRPSQEQRLARWQKSQKAKPVEQKSEPVEQKSDPVEEDQAENQKRTYSRRPVICKTFPYAASLFGDQLHGGPWMSHEDRLARHLQRIQDSEKRRKTPKAVANERRVPRPIFLNVFPFAAKLTLAGTDAAPQKSHKIRQAAWLARTIA